MSPDAGKLRRKVHGTELHVGIGVSIAAAAALGYALTKKKERNPYSLFDWKQQLREDGGIRDWPSALGHIIEKGLKDAETKRELWPLLLGVLEPGMSQMARTDAMDAYRGAYQQLVASCQDIEVEILERIQRHQRAAATAAISAAAPADTSESSGNVNTAAQLGSLKTTTSFGSDVITSPSVLLPLPSPSPWTVAVSSLDLPREMKQFYDAQRIIVMDAIRTDFKKNSLTTVSALSNWVSSALAESTTFQRFSSLSSPSVAKQQDYGGSGTLGQQQQEPWEIVSPRSGCSSTNCTVATNSSHLTASESVKAEALLWVSGLARHHLHQCTHFGGDQKRQIMRLVCLLSAYAVHDPETGYCQGMSDLALPFLLLIEDDALAFWCFERLMRKVRQNFSVEDDGIFAQLRRLSHILEASDPLLFSKLEKLDATDCRFAYRMIVVLMRRELSLEQTLRLWEIMWADDLLMAMPSTMTAMQEEDTDLVGKGHAAESVSLQAGASEEVSASTNTAITGMDQRVVEDTRSDDSIISTTVMAGRPGQAQASCILQPASELHSSSTTCTDATEEVEKKAVSTGAMVATINLTSTPSGQPLCESSEEGSVTILSPAAAPVSATLAPGSVAEPSSATWRSRLMAGILSFKSRRTSSTTLPSAATAVSPSSFTHPTAASSDHDHTKSNTVSAEGQQPLKSSPSSSSSLHHQHNKLLSLNIMVLMSETADHDEELISCSITLHALPPSSRNHATADVVPQAGIIASSLTQDQPMSHRIVTEHSRPYCPCIIQQGTHSSNHDAKDQQPGHHYRQQVNASTPVSTGLSAADHKLLLKFTISVCLSPYLPPITCTITPISTPAVQVNTNDVCSSTPSSNSLNSINDTKQAPAGELATTAGAAILQPAAVNTPSWTTRLMASAGGLFSFSSSRSSRMSASSADYPAATEDHHGELPAASIDVAAVVGNLAPVIASEHHAGEQCITSSAVATELEAVGEASALSADAGTLSNGEPQAIVHDSAVHVPTDADIAAVHSSADTVGQEKSEHGLQCTPPAAQCSGKDNACIASSPRPPQLPPPLESPSSSDCSSPDGGAVVYVVKAAVMPADGHFSAHKQGFEKVPTTIEEDVCDCVSVDSNSPCLQPLVLKDSPPTPTSQLNFNMSDQHGDILQGFRKIDCSPPRSCFMKDGDSMPHSITMCASPSLASIVEPTTATATATATATVLRSAEVNHEYGSVPPAAGNVDAMPVQTSTAGVLRCEGLQQQPAQGADSRASFIISEHNGHHNDDDFDTAMGDEANPAESRALLESCHTASDSTGGGGAAAAGDNASSRVLELLLADVVQDFTPAAAADDDDDDDDDDDGVSRDISAGSQVSHHHTTSRVAADPGHVIVTCQPIPGGVSPNTAAVSLDHHKYELPHADQLLAAGSSNDDASRLLLTATDTGCCTAFEHLGTDAATSDEQIWSVEAAAKRLLAHHSRNPSSSEQRIMGHSRNPSSSEQRIMGHSRNPSSSEQRIMGHSRNPSSSEQRIMGHSRNTSTSGFKHSKSSSLSLLPTTRHARSTSSLSQQHQLQLNSSRKTTTSELSTKHSQNPSAAESSLHSRNASGAGCFSLSRSPSKSEHVGHHHSRNPSSQFQHTSKEDFAVEYNVLPQSAAGEVEEQQQQRQQQVHAARRRERVSDLLSNMNDDDSQHFLNAAAAGGEELQESCQDEAATYTPYDDYDEQGMGLLLYVVAAVVGSQRRTLMDYCIDSDDVLKHFQSVRFDVFDIVAQARLLRSRLMTEADEAAAGRSSCHFSSAAVTAAAAEIGMHSEAAYSGVSQ
ncbi:hypothetical protein CEUSTIGMA_g12666.t1 [Chlamydomonas eustigma]|uniref:Rab-GAP TBC domain-containing protein n=1 Tax=Chlamydomonas eustigma TaxID=1157962 RepID=A0A250XQC2_9CHLO|nr:hypothetical protein CEUSTIGMA_g12666.t1 [Chlamydomonas eustigma]|eukprot:GAX85246.1 hypothetical protein CEUSTIGMA_g12666.t1 [Chlamydomonas eustigma]